MPLGRRVTQRARHEPDALAAIRATACQPRRQKRGPETRDQAQRRGMVDIALVGIRSDAGLSADRIAQRVKPQATIYTDEFASYRGLPNHQTVHTESAST